MRKYIILGMLIVAGPALSQEPAEFRLTVTPAELNVIGVALGERPYREVAPLLAKLDAQLKEQRAPKAERPVEQAPGGAKE